MGCMCMSLVQRFTTPVNVLEQLLGGVVTPSVVINLLPGHEGYTVSLSNRGENDSHCTEHEVTVGLMKFHIDLYNPRQSVLAIM